MKHVLAGIALCLLGGCASLPSPQEAANADYGQYPSDYEQIAHNYYEMIAKDPSSLQYRSITVPRQFWLGNRFTGAQYGYLVCVTVNAKNGFGGYVGFETDALLIRNGTVIQYLQRGDWFGRQMC